jgi:hypothetical protein
MQNEPKTAGVDGPIVSQYVDGVDAVSLLIKARF